MGPWIASGMCHPFLQGSTKQFSVIFRRFFAAPHTHSEYRLLTSFGSSGREECKGLEKALHVLDLINPQTSIVRGSHVRLIQGCLKDLLEIDPKKCSKLASKTTHWKTTEPRQTTYENQQGNDSMLWKKLNFLKDDNFWLPHEVYKRRTNSDATTLSGLLSSCGARGALVEGMQLHSLSLKTGLDKCSSVGSSLISLYSKCGHLGYAYHVFEKMTERNTVLWTAVIAGYAQHWQVETCLQLFIKMKDSTTKPNDFTFASLLSACTGSGCLWLGTTVHSQEIQMGFDSYIHVVNALISMYAKCGSIKESCCIFEKMQYKDIISWNSMISGYALHGLAEQAISLLNKMEQQNIAPDAITFLGVLSSCRHAGLVEQGRQCFNLMLGNGIVPELDHYSCIVDLLGRAGLLEEASNFITEMPIHPNAVMWGSLLSSCRVHGNVWIGIQAAESQLLLEPGCAATHVQLANLYASVGCWKYAAEVRKLMKEKGIKTSPGFSWIEVGNEVHKFKAEDGSNDQVMEIILVLDCLVGHMKNFGHIPEIDLHLYM